MAKTDFWLGSESYHCDPELAHSFRVARELGMPLLIEGEPGTGKTELPIQYAEDQGLNLFIYPAGSKSSVDQFVAKFDHVKYLRDSQIEILNAQRKEKNLELLVTTSGSTNNLDDYINLGPGSQSYLSPNSVLLIDEIDKAPREFPNDLLFALSHRKFILPESGRVITTTEEEMPAIVITSNREQELPTAFKGRCIYHYITFPTPELMRTIVDKHFSNVDEDLVQKALDFFYQMRKLGLDKAPSTRELLNWLKFLMKLDKDEALEDIRKMQSAGILIKTKDDMEKVKARIQFQK